MKYPLDVNNITIEGRSVQEKKPCFIPKKNSFDQSNSPRA